MLKFLRKWLLQFLICLAFVFILTHYVIMLCYIPSQSMEPTLSPGDYIITTRFNTGSIERYEIIIFPSPDDEQKYYVKRVIGLPGETIEIKGNEVYADGVLLDDSFTDGSTSGNETYEVPEGCYMVLGDNRDDSYDSRYWGYVDGDDIISKAVCKFYPGFKML